MQRRRLGPPEVSALGLVGISEFYGQRDDEPVATIHRGIGAGIDFIDTADMNGPFTNG